MALHHFGLCFRTGTCKWVRRLSERKLNLFSPSDSSPLSFFHMMGVRAAPELIPTQPHTVAGLRGEPVFLWEQPFAVRSQQCSVPAVGGRSRGTGPRWISGQHLFHLLTASYQQKGRSTLWTREDGEERTFLAEFKKTSPLLFVL